MGTEFDPFGNKKPMPTSSEDNQTDILQTDIKESHYALVHKDYEFIKFFRDFCSHADFLYKGKYWENILIVKFIFQKFFKVMMIYFWTLIRFREYCKKWSKTKNEWFMAALNTVVAEAVGR